MHQITVNVPDTLLAQLQREADSRELSLDAVVLNLLQDCFQDEDGPTDEDEPTKEEILADLREGFRDAFAGRVRPVDEVLAELKQEFDFDGDDS